MAKKSWFQVIKDAVQMYLDRDKYAYFYGAKGQKLTKATMDALWNAEPGHFKKYSAEEKEQIYRNSLNKIGYDCSGFVDKVTGETGYSKEIYAKRTKETTLTDGVQGQFLFTTWGGTGRHIGIDAGFGFCLDMAYESTDKRVREHKDSVRLARIKDIAWEHSFQTAAVNYDHSYSTDPNANPSPEPTYMTGEVVNCQALYLRTGPTKDAPKCYINREDGKGKRCVLYAGETVPIKGEQNGWYQTHIQGKVEYWEPWVCADYIKIIG